MIKCHLGEKMHLVGDSVTVSDILLNFVLETLYAVEAKYGMKSDLLHHFEKYHHHYLHHEAVKHHFECATRKGRTHFPASMSKMGL